MEGHSKRKHLMINATAHHQHCYYAPPRNGPLDCPSPLSSSYSAQQHHQYSSSPRGPWSSPRGPMYGHYSSEEVNGSGEFEFYQEDGNSDMGSRGMGGRSNTPLAWRRRNRQSFDDERGDEDGYGEEGSFRPLKPKPGPGAFDVKNDYSQHFLETGERPQNFIRDVTVEEGFAEYPKQARLLAAKDEVVASRVTPSMHLNVDLKTFDLRSLGTKFDLIYIDPPWEEYARRSAPFVVGGKAGGSCEGGSDMIKDIWSYDDIGKLPIDEIADTPSFIFLWCGSGGRVTEDINGPLHVDDGRRLLMKWGFRRCEEICWIKTNKAGPQQQKDLQTSTTSLLVRTKEHCLMGIKGSVRRNRDGHIIHCNVHTDLVVGEQPLNPLSLQKPEEMYKIMEHFCLGRRRLELFGCPHNIRPGWVTIGNQLPTPSTYDPAKYLGWMNEPGVNPDGTPCPGHLVGSTPLIEDLRPKTPPRGATAAVAMAAAASIGSPATTASGDIGSPLFRPTVSPLEGAASAMTGATMIHANPGVHMNVRSPRAGISPPLRARPRTPPAYPQSPTSPGHYHPPQQQQYEEYYPPGPSSPLSFSSINSMGSISYYAAGEEWYHHPPGGGGGGVTNYYQRRGGVGGRRGGMGVFSRGRMQGSGRGRGGRTTPSYT